MVWLLMMLYIEVLLEDVGSVFFGALASVQLAAKSSV